MVLAKSMMASPDHMAVRTLMTPWRIYNMLCINGMGTCKTTQRTFALYIIWSWSLFNWHTSSSNAIRNRTTTTSMKHSHIAAAFAVKYCSECHRPPPSNPNFRKSCSQAVAVIPIMRLVHQPQPPALPHPHPQQPHYPQ